jgi:hypothetical protein
MGDVMQIPVPKTPEGARWLGLALDAQFRAERWARRRRIGSFVALAAGGAIVVDTTFGILSRLVRQGFVAIWWVALAAAVIAAGVEVWATLRLQRIVTEIRAAASDPSAERG